MSANCRHRHLLLAVAPAAALLFVTTWVRVKIHNHPSGRSARSAISGSGLDHHTEVKQRVASAEKPSQVVEHGSTNIKDDILSFYQGPEYKKLDSQHVSFTGDPGPSISNCDDEVDIWILKEEIQRAGEASAERVEAEKKLADLMSHHEHVDQSIQGIVKALVGEAKTPAFLFTPSSKVSHWDWNCIKSLISTYQEHCGSLKVYGFKYSPVFAKLCMLGVNKDKMAQLSAKICAQS